ncbi:DegT/DnrJ/EryC1/StrS family aminotransferase [Candidatus Gottesmanbacteria bacterium]|nr:DegT/DnrJ/EryC1/StrS family aminotransferase [Candidatus Gottesmanbacteria bacterium]
MKRQISFNGVQSLVSEQKNKLLGAFSRVIDSGVFLQGKENAALTAELEKRLPGGYVIPVASGHDALLLSLKALNLKPTDEVIFPVNAYPTAFPIALCGATPVPVDVDKNGQLDSDLAEKAITKNTRAVVVVHLYGLVGNLPLIIMLCNKHKLVLIEDAAQAFGSTFDGKPVGTFGDIGCFSFYPTKNLGALGDGGAIWTGDKKIASFVAQAKMYGEKIRYRSLFVAGHSRLAEVQAGGLRVYLKNFDRMAQKRKQVAEWYKKALDLRVLSWHPQSDPVQHLFVIACARRDELKKYLASRGIPTAIHYPLPIHRVAAFSDVIKAKKNFPMADYLASHILSLPFHQYLSQADVSFIAEATQSFYNTTRFSK